MYRNNKTVRTLPITCQICFEHLKDPCVCANLHPFCSDCLEEWLKREQSCPTCRVTITKKQFIIGSNEETTTGNSQKRKRTPLLKLYQLTEERFQASEKEREYFEKKSNELSVKVGELEATIEDRDLEIQKLITTIVTKKSMENMMNKSMVVEPTDILNQTHRMINNDKSTNKENITQSPIKKPEKSKSARSKSANLKESSKELKLPTCVPVRRSLRLVNKPPDDTEDTRSTKKLKI